LIAATGAAQFARSQVITDIPAKYKRLRESEKHGKVASSYCCA